MTDEQASQLKAIYDFVQRNGWDYKNASEKANQSRWELGIDAYQKLTNASNTLIYKNPSMNGDKDVYRLITETAKGVEELSKRLEAIEKKLG